LKAYRSGRLLIKVDMVCPLYPFVLLSYAPAYRGRHDSLEILSRFFFLSMGSDTSDLTLFLLFITFFVVLTYISRRNYYQVGWMDGCMHGFISCGGGWVFFFGGLIGFYTVPFFNLSSRLWELCNYDTKAKRG